MNNKYKINTNWSLEGKDNPSEKDKPSIYRVIMNLIGELNKSLKVPMMEETKNDEEVRKILDNPEGITIEELQIIDVWGIDKKLRRKVRHELDLAYRYLSAELAHLIATRNDMESRGLEKSNKIDTENGELKNTIVNQYKLVEKQVQDYEEKGKLSEKERKLLVYIRKVYLKALSETIERIFLTASKNTKRTEIFPRNEQQTILNNISNLQEKISSLTWESKQKQKEQQREDDKKFELEKKELEKELSSLKELKEVLNNSFPGLISNENKINEEVRKSIAENSINSKEFQQQLDNLIKEIDEKTLQGLNWVQARNWIGKVKINLKEIINKLNQSQQLIAQIEQK